MAPLVTATERRPYRAGTTAPLLKQLVLLPAFILALAPGMTASLVYREAASSVTVVRHTVSVPAGSGEVALKSLPFRSSVDGDGGPPVP